MSILFFCQNWACWYVFYYLIKFSQSLQLLCVPDCNIFIALYLVCKAWSFAAIISHSFSPFISPLESQRNVSSSQISCVSILPIHWPCISLLSHFFFKDPTNLASMCWVPAFRVSLFSSDWLNSSATFAAVLIVELIFRWLLSWLLTIFTTWSSAYFVFRYSAILSPLYTRMSLVTGVFPVFFPFYV